MKFSLIALGLLTAATNALPTATSNEDVAARVNIAKRASITDAANGYARSAEIPLSLHGFHHVH